MAAVIASQSFGDRTRVDLSGFKVAVIATDGFEQEELIEPVKALRQAHAMVDVISLKTGSIQGFKHLDKGETVHVDKVLSQVKSEDYNGLLLPGGAVNADALRVVPEAKTFVIAFDQAHKPIAAICHAPWLLISAGLVRGRTLTSYHTIQDDVMNAGGDWQDKEVIIDRNWVTSRQPSDLPAFNRAMIELFTQSKAPQEAFVPADQASGLAGLPTRQR